MQFKAITAVTSDFLPTLGLQQGLTGPVVTVLLPSATQQTGRCSHRIRAIQASPTDAEGHREPLAGGGGWSMLVTRNLDRGCRLPRPGQLQPWPARPEWQAKASPALFQNSVRARPAADFSAAHSPAQTPGIKRRAGGALRRAGAGNSRIERVNSKWKNSPVRESCSHG
jgi:hypothetical protein